MTAASKLFLNKKTIKYFDSIPYSCYELIHCVEPNCYFFSFNVFCDAIKYSLKLYSTFYVLSLLMKLRKKNNFNLKTFKKLPRDIMQSSLFLSLNSTLFTSFFCISRYILGKFYGWHALVVGTLAGSIALKIESKSRRRLIMLYSLNLACETLFNMAVSRSLITAVPNGEVLIFIVTSAAFMSLFRMSCGLNKHLKRSLRLIIGNGEENFDREQSSRKGDGMTQFVGKELKQFHGHDKLCRHPCPCILYILKGFVRNFSLGYGLQTCLNVLLLLQRRLSFANFVKSLTKLKTCSLGLFVGLYNALFRSCNCLLRWLFSEDFPALFGAISGAVAGASAYFYKSKTISLYFLFKLLEVLCYKAVDWKWFPQISNLDMIIYGLNFGIVMHAAFLEPHNLRPSFWKFLCRISAKTMPLTFRKLYDVYGTKASLLNPDYIPDLDPKYVTSPDVQMLMKVSGRWK